MSDVVINLDAIHDLLQEGLDRVADVNGAVVPEALKGRNRSAEVSAITKNLLYLAHLCDKARVLVMDEYHRTRFEGRDV